MNDRACQHPGCDVVGPTIEHDPTTGRDVCETHDPASPVTLTMTVGAARLLSDLLDVNDDDDTLTDWGYSSDDVDALRAAVATATLATPHA